ncbi:NAD-dependent epimerase/dehydratase family protein [Hypericibacter sp.]|uniref:NAD-dependent epimerase/dehydratase family protein n=1 Tax=Hypericibacter sp. TaxID=2705401 RepID=UPI003D6D8F12
MTQTPPPEKSPIPQRPLGRVLVTGARGFIGATLLERLKRDGVAAVGSDLPSDKPASADFRPCDITDQGQVDALVDGDEFDTILHCGAVSGPMVMADRPLEIWRINAMGTAHLLEAARRHRVGRFLLCSTTEIFGSRSGPRIDEDTPPSPDGVYGASKVAAEQALIGYVRERGLDGVALRLSWIYGPGRITPTMLEQLLRASLAGRPFEIEGSPAEVTHYLYIDDVVDGLLAAARAPRVPRLTYNITAGDGQTLEQVVSRLRAFAPETRVSFTGHGVHATGPAGFDLTQAARDLGYRPRVPLAEGLRRYREALRSTPR